MMGLEFNTERRLGSLLFGGILTILVVLALTPKTHAATLNVVAGDDGIDNNNQCQLTEAIVNINDQAQTHDDCVAGDSNNDTVNVAAGTTTLTDDLPPIVKSVTIQGQGMGQTTIDGDGQYNFEAVRAEVQGIISIRNLTVTAFADIAFQVTDSVAGSVINISNVEIDGSASNSFDGAAGGIIVAGDENYTTNIDNVYIHNIAADGLNGGVFGISVQSVNNGVLDINITNTTIASISSSDVSGSGIAFITGLFDSSLTPGTINANVSNSTIVNVSGIGFVNDIAAMGAVNGGTSTISVNVSNSTFLNTSESQYTKGFALASIAVGASDQALATITSSNNIFAGHDNNCSAVGDVAAGIGFPNPSEGTITQTISSQGGNISDDVSCNDYFTQASDKKRG